MPVPDAPYRVPPRAARLPAHIVLPRQRRTSTALVLDGLQHVRDCAGCQRCDSMRRTFEHLRHCPEGARCKFDLCRKATWWLSLHVLTCDDANCSLPHCKPARDTHCQRCNDPACAWRVCARAPPAAAAAAAVAPAEAAPAVAEVSLRGDTDATTTVLEGA